MQFKYLGEFDEGSKVQQKIAEQCEIWTLEALRGCIQSNIDEAAKLFGSSKSTLLSRLQKYGIQIEPDSAS